MEDLSIQDYQRAERAVTLEETRQGFLYHAGSYVFFNILMIIFNFVTDPDYLWFLFPLFGWGIGLAMHYFFGVRRANEEIEQRQVKIVQRASQS